MMRYSASHLEWSCRYDADSPSWYWARGHAVEFDSPILCPLEELIVDLHALFVPQKRWIGWRSTLAGTELLESERVVSERKVRERNSTVSWEVVQQRSSRAGANIVYLPSS